MPSWRTNVLPKIRKYFGKLGSKGPSKAAIEAAKEFDTQKESIEKEIEEKKAELEPKIIEIYRDSKPDAKFLLKEPTDAKVKEQAEIVKDLIQKIAEAGCPGASTLKEATEKHGVPHLSVQVTYLLEKISPFLASEEFPVIPKVEEVKIEEITKEEEVKTEEITKEITPEEIEKEKKPAEEEIKEAAQTETVEASLTSVAPPAPETPKQEEPKVEAVPAPETPKQEEPKVEAVAKDEAAKPATEETPTDKKVTKEDPPKVEKKEAEIVAAEQKS